MEKELIIPIILLNWNNADDTIDCIRSLCAMEGVSFSVVIADNHSQDDSIEKIIQWLKEADYPYLQIAEGEKVQKLTNQSFHILRLTQNYGFAKGNNLALEAISETNYTSALVLNNDTVVNPDFLLKLVEYKGVQQKVKLLTPLICYYDHPEKIWNAGGKIFFGFRKYFYADKLKSDINASRPFQISFVTGCALFFSREILTEGKLFTERFFFGEEDFELALRMKHQKVRMACVPDSIVLHKVSSSTSHLPPKNKIYLHYLNRYIDIKLNSNAVYFFIWKYIYALYLVLLLNKTNFSFSEVFDFLSRLMSESQKLNGVDYPKFKEIMEGVQ